MLNSRNSTMIIISHDRHFLNMVCTHMADLDYGELRVYPGNYDDYMTAATQARERLIADNAKKKAQIADLQSFVSRFSANASKSRQATSRLKQIDKIKIEEVKVSSRQNPFIRFEQEKKLYRNILEIEGVSKGYGDGPLFKGLNMMLEVGEKVAILGTNGIGKSTLIKTLVGALAPDTGTIKWSENAQIGYYAQDHAEDFDTDLNVFDWMAQWKQENEDEQAVRSVLGRLLFSQDDIKKPVKVLSGGEQGRMLFGKLMMQRPNILIMDEPTNHLDIAVIEWLETFLAEFKGAIVFIRHDRAFIHKVATRIVDLDRGKVTSWPGNYDEYLVGKEEWLRVEALQQAEFDKKLAQEEAWIRQGIKARRTRNEGRVRALKALRRERQDRRELQGNAKLQVDEAKRSGKLVFEVEHLNYAVDGRQLLVDVNLQVLRGDKIALIGPNGCGKTTLIKLLLGDLQPSSGQVRTGTKLDVAYFDQYRQQLDPDKTVMDNLAEGKSEVEVAGRRRHVLGYLQDFLFEPRRAMTPVRALSGGEKNRLLLARLFLKPCNLLILDEPTNDLDVETLELLEELLAEYQATLLLVSHDRRFIDNTVTHSWVFEGDGRITEYVGGYADMMALRQQLRMQQESVRSVSKEVTAVADKGNAQPRRSKKLSYKLQLELDSLPARLEALEQEVTHYQAQINQPDFFSKDSQETQTILAALQASEEALETAFMRWEELEAMKQED